MKETTLKEINSGNATPRDNMSVKISNGAPIQDGWSTEASTAEIKASRCGLNMFWLISAISFAERFETCLRNKAYVYLLQIPVKIFGTSLI